MATPVCIGVCPGSGGTNDRKVGSPKMTVASGVMTLDVAQTGVLIGPGTCIKTYAGSTYYYYVTEVLSDTKFVVTRREYPNPPDISSPQTVQTISFPYASLSTAEAGITTVLGSTSLTSKDVQVFIYVYGGASADTTNCTFDGCTTDATRNINIVAASAKQTVDGSEWRALGVEDSSKYILAARATLSNPYTTVDGLQIPGKSSSGDGSIKIIVANCQALNCILKSPGSTISTAYAIDITTSGSTGCLVQNCVISGWDGSQGGGIKVLTANAVVVHHCTISDCTRGIAGSDSNSTLTLVNTLVFNNDTDFYYISSTQPNWYNNCSDTIPYGTDGIDASPGSVEADDWALLVKDYASGDVRPKDSYCSIYKAGRGWTTDSSLPTTDIMLLPRNLDTPSIGAYEKSADGAGYGQMDVWVKAAGTFKKLITGYVLSGGIWKPLRSVYVLVNGVWKQIYVLSVVGHVLNPSFEMWDGGNLRYFTLVGTGATITKDTSDYYADGTSVRLTRGSAGGMLYQDVHNDEGLSYWKGHKVHADVMCKAEDPCTVCLRLEDGVGSSTHIHHSGSRKWEKLEAEIDVDAAATMVRVILDVGGGVAGKFAKFDLLNLYVV